MGKKRKSFREAWEDDEWGKNDQHRKRNDKQKQQRKKARKQKFADRWYDEDFNLKRKK